MPPNTDVMPARYTVESNARPPIAVNEIDVTTVWRYAKRQPPMPAMNDEIAKLAIFTPVTFTPMPAADRSLARTASIAEPSGLARSQATANATATSVNRQSKPNSKRGNAWPAPTPRFESEELGFRDRCTGRRNELAVTEPERFDGVREREGDDAERQAANAQRRKSDDDADRRWR